MEIGERDVQDMTTKETKRAMRDRPLRLVFQRALESADGTPRDSKAELEGKSPGMLDCLAVMTRCAEECTPSRFQGGG